MVEAKQFGEKMTLWLTYWLIHSLTNKVEDFLGAISSLVIGLNFLEGYLFRIARILFFAWLIHPKYQGALYVYDLYIQKQFSLWEKTIRQLTLTGITRITDSVSQASKRVQQKLDKK